MTVLFLRREKLDEKAYLVVPVIALQEGVFNGVYHPLEELSVAVQAWNGSPITVNHPTLKDTPVSANSPQILESQTIGILYNSLLEDKKLKGEAWLDVEKTKRIGFENMIDHFDAGKVMNVSVGYFSLKEDKEGTFGDKPYKQIARGFRPDHLALLPDDNGACTLEEGCGAMRTFSEQLMTILKELNPMKSKEKEPGTVQKEGVNVPEEQLAAFHKWQEEQKNAVTLEALQKALPYKAEDIAFLNNLRKREEAKLNALKEDICKCNKGVTREMLDTMSEEALQSLAMNTTGTDYSLLGGAPHVEGTTFEEYPAILSKEMLGGESEGESKLKAKVN